MRVLFVCSGNKTTNGPGAVVKNQAETLVKQGIEVEFFLVIGRGVYGYLSKVPKLYSLIKKNKYDVIHAHFSDSAYLATLSTTRPLVVSLMGSDVLANGFTKWILLFFHRYWEATIVKSKGMHRKLGIKSARVIPNGVDFSKFNAIGREEACRALGWETDKKHVVFLADPARYEKNHVLAQQGFSLIKESSVLFKVAHSVPHSQIYLYYYAADVILMTSLHEGSPNVIKEAMACGCPIVSTDVGDVKELTNGIDGCFIAPFDPEGVATQIKKALAFGKRTTGRQRLIDLSMDSVSIANKIIDVYKNVGE